MDINKIPIKKDNVFWRKNDKKDEIYIFEPSESNLCSLSGVSSFIWVKCNGKNNIEDIIKLVEKKYDITMNVAKRDVICFIQQLIDAELVMINPSDNLVEII